MEEQEQQIRRSRDAANGIEVVAPEVVGLFVSRPLEVELRSDLSEQALRSLHHRQQSGSTAVAASGQSELRARAPTGRREPKVSWPCNTCSQFYGGNNFTTWLLSLRPYWLAVSSHPIRSLARAAGSGARRSRPSAAEAPPAGEPSELTRTI